jgi:hypothetical protein
LDRKQSQDANDEVVAEVVEVDADRVAGLLERAVAAPRGSARSAYPCE